MSFLHTFKNWFFEQLPPYFKVSDSYKDGDGKGLLERYLTLFGDELDSEVVNKVNTFTDILDCKTTPVELLHHLAFLVGSPPRMVDDADYRNLICHIVSIYKIKGTKCSFEVLFNLNGLNIKINEIPPPPPVKYDVGLTYDTGLTYDRLCLQCSEFEIIYWSKLDDCQIPIINSIPQAKLDKIKDIICFITPINTVLKELSHAITYCEDITPQIENEVTIFMELPNAHDRSLNYDQGALLDGFIATSSSTYIF